MLWETLAPSYDAAYSRTVDFAEDMVVRDALPGLAGRCVFDLGCGTGWLLDYASSSLPPDEYIGIDISPAMLQVARGKWPRHTFVLGDMCRLAAFPDGSADVVVSTFSSICYCRDPWAAGAEAVRLLRPGGALFFMACTSRGRRRKVPGVDASERSACWAFTPSGFRALFPGLERVRVRGLNLLGDRVYQAFGANCWEARTLMLAESETLGRLIPGAAYFMILSGRKAG